MDAVCPCAEGLTDRLSTLRNDIFAGAPKLVVDTLGVALDYIS